MRTTVIISTVVIIAAALAMVVALGSLMTSGKNNTSPEVSSSNNDVYTPTSTTIEEVQTSIEELLLKNCDLISLFYTKGFKILPEPYGNAPEDGYYTADTSGAEYDSYEKIKELVYNVLGNENGELFLKENEYLYKDKVDGTLGISEKFSPNLDYSLDWKDVAYEIEFTAENTLNLSVVLKSNTNSEEETFLRTVSKENGKWVLSSLIYN